MTKIEALTKHFGCNPCDIRVLDMDERLFEVLDNKYRLLDDEELEEEAKTNIEEVFNDCYDEEGLSKWVKDNGGVEEFYNEEYINDFRIEDSEQYGEMNDMEIIRELNELGYFETITMDQLDMQKMVEYVWGVDGAQGLSRVDGKIDYCEGYNLIKED